MFAQIPQAQPVGQLIFDQLACRLREQHLAAVRRGADACRARHIEPDVSGRRDARLARVETDPYQQTCGREVTLEPRCGGDGVRGAWKGGEERLALRVDLVPL